jgi:transcription initiation factor TFIID subunit 5
MMKNPKKFTELIERTTNSFKEKCNKEIYIKNKDRLRILDGSTPSDYFVSLEIVEDWMDKCIDDIRNYVKPFSYPLFVHLYLDLISKDCWGEGKFLNLKLAKRFFEKFSNKYTSFIGELDQLNDLKDPLNMNTPILSNYLKNKVHIYVPRTIFDFFIHFLNTNNLILILDILNKYFERSSKF